MSETSTTRDDEEQWMRLTESEAQLNLRAVLELCAAGELRCSEKTSRPSAATVDTVAVHLVQGDFYDDELPIASYAWPLLIQAGGLAKSEGGRLRLTAKGRSALGKPPAEVLRQLWQRWLTHAPIDEFSRIEEIKGQRAANVLTAVKTRRQMVAQGLASCPPGEWIDLDTLFLTMRRGNMSPIIVRNDMALWKLYLVDAQYGSLGYADYSSWEMLEGRYTLAVLFEYAASLGMIDLHYVHPHGARDDFRGNWGAEDLEALSRYDGLFEIRLTELGRYALGLTDSYQPLTGGQEGAPVEVLPSLDVLAPESLPAGDQLLLSSYAKKIANRAWTISVESLLAAIDSGRDLQEFAGFLVQRSGHAVPGTLETLISDVARRVAQLTDLGHARVIECADAEVATLISQDRNLRSKCQLIGDRHLLVPLDQDLKFRKALVKLGYAVTTSVNGAG